jgi:hypothetical protein
MRRITTAGSRFGVGRPTNEELMIARHTSALPASPGTKESD